MVEQSAVSAGYDLVYTAMPESPTLRRLWREHACGVDFPDDFYHISFVTLDQLERMAGELRVGQGDHLVDFGCGAGGPLMWMARRTGARATGIDFSAVGVALARRRAAALGLGEQARFEQGSFAGSGLESASVDAIMSEDALQYAPDKRAAFAEAARVLRPGGRLVFFAFELDPERAAGLPILGEDVVADYRPVLEAADFSVGTYETASGWPEPTTAAYSALLAAREALVPEMGEPAFNALAGELVLTLERTPYRARVFVCATRR
jgi:ubiquinone/menaquinone biosynthesis C-methylase UbiE